MVMAIYHMSIHCSVKKTSNSTPVFTTATHTMQCILYMHIRERLSQWSLRNQTEVVIHGWIAGLQRVTVYLLRNEWLHEDILFLIMSRLQMKLIIQYSSQPR